MSKLNSDAANEQRFPDLNADASPEIKQLLAKLQHSHEMREKMLNMEIWALVETMDRFLPGFWSRFLENRRTTLKQFLAKKRTCNSERC